ncbi:MAG TPA: SpoIIE family protein phosphatase [Thermoanaerobaculia bacterium]|nr:SpoIIE family protein phosphatase [Thermoanaerobaculia bacterium]
MKLRTQLLLAFLVLAILPLSGIVLYGQVSSERAFRRAVEEDARQLTSEIERNMETARRDLRQRWSALKNAPSIEGLRGAGLEEQAFEKAIESALAGMGDVFGVVRSIEVVPTPPAPGALALPGHPGVAVRPVDPAHEHPPGASLAIELQADQIAQASQRLAKRLMQMRDELDRQRAIARSAQNGEGGSPADLHQAIDAAVAADALEVEVRHLEARSDQLEKLLGDDFSAVIAGGLGRLDADIDVRRFFSGVLARTRRENGEVPFALGPGRELYVISEEDRDRLLQLAGGDREALRELIAGSEGISDRDGWVMATRRDPETELIFGIARPIRESLAEMQRAAGSNFLLGLGMISFALIGVLPLSRRLSQGLQRLTAEADRLASGDLAARAHVGGRDELGQLATAFNRMAAQLEENQGRLVEQERREREQEVERRVLEAENARRGEELEAARRFQLSMLPARLPRHPEYDVAVLMKTATEVGGDYYDFLAPDGDDGVAGPLTVAIGDATGHGARAGTMVTVIKALFASRARECRPDGFLAEANRAIKGMALERMTMALLVARFDRGRVELAAAGMPPPLVHRASSPAAAVEAEEIPLSGLPLGAMEGAAYRSTQVELAPGDCLLLMSDGFAELPDARCEPIGYGAVRELFGRVGGGSADDAILELTSALEAITGGGAPTDDVTFVVVRRRA